MVVHFIHHFLHLILGFGIVCAIFGAVVIWIPTVIYYRHKVKRIRNG